MFRDRIMALMRHVPVIGPVEEEFDPFADVEPETHADHEGDDRVHADGPPGEGASR
jgi:hypothetical protein